MIFGTVLLLHSLVRWVALIAGVLVLVRAASSRRRRATYEASHRTLGSAFVGALHLNFVLGLLMYAVLSPLPKLAFHNVSAAMSSSVLRFFFIEHPFGMLVGIAVASIGARKIRKSEHAAEKHRRTLIYYGAALSIIFVSIPWPFYPAGRPLLHWPF